MIQTQIRPSSKKATTNSTDCVSEELSTSLVDRTHEFETQLPTVNVAQVPSSLSPADVTVTTIIDDDLHSTENERDLIDSSSPLDLSLPRVPTNILNNHVSTSPSTLPSIIDTHVTATTYDNFDLEDNTSISMTESIPTENDLSRPSLGQMESDCYIDVETIGEEDHSRQDFSNEPLTVVENVVQRKSSRLATIRRKRFYSPDEDQIKTSRRKSKKKT
jgi:hypothetical protein